MFNRRTSAKILAVTSSLAFAGLLAAAPAHAKDGDVVASGTCSAGSAWSMKLGPRDNVIETEFEVDSNIVGQKWKVQITDNGATVFRGARTTTAPSGSFAINIRPTNQAGTDSFVATATTKSTGESCTASASV